MSRVAIPTKVHLQLLQQYGPDYDLNDLLSYLLIAEGNRQEREAQVESVRSLIERGIVIDCTPVLHNARIKDEQLKKMSVDIVIFNWNMFEKKLKGKGAPKSCEFTETVRLLKRFMDSVEQAPEDTHSTQFQFDDWVCEVVAYQEGTTRILAFREADKEAEL